MKIEIMEIIQFEDLPEEIQFQFGDACTEEFGAISRFHPHMYIEWKVGINEDEADKLFKNFPSEPVEDNLSHNSGVCSWLRKNGFKVGDSILIKVKT